MIEGSPVSERLLNRELSWLDFNTRVLALADDERVPLLERVKFSAIFSSNLDEFFQVRVAALKDQVAAGITRPSPDGRTPAQQLIEISDRVEVLVREQERVLLERLVPALRDVRCRAALVGRARPGRPQEPGGGLRAAHLPGADPAVVRPRAPVPLHLEPLAEPRA